MEIHIQNNVFEKLHFPIMSWLTKNFTCRFPHVLLLRHKAQQSGRRHRNERWNHRSRQQHRAQNYRALDETSAFVRNRGSQYLRKPRTWRLWSTCFRQHKLRRINFEPARTNQSSFHGHWQFSHLGWLNSSPFFESSKTHYRQRHLYLPIYLRERCCVAKRNSILFRWTNFITTTKRSSLSSNLTLNI